MSFSINRQHHYQEFKQALEQMQRSITGSNLDRAALLASFEEIWQHFSRHILGAANSESAMPEREREQSYLTEIHKQLRLLELDLKFLQASRQSTTAKTRQAAVDDRIKTLIEYCGVFLQQEK